MNPNAFVRAGERRRFRRGKRADIQARHAFFRRTLTNALDRFWSGAMKQPVDWEACGFRQVTNDDVAFVRGMPGVYGIVDR